MIVAFDQTIAKRMAMIFKVVLYPSEEGMAVCAPSLPGCWSQGHTEEEALASIAVAIREYLEAEIEPDGTSEERGYVREVDVAI